jgi:hypothetical protein
MNRVVRPPSPMANINMANISSMSDMPASRLCRLAAVACALLIFVEVLVKLIGVTNLRRLLRGAKL